MVTIITKAVIEQTITVSTNGPIEATIPSLAGNFVFTAACAIDADPTPASFEKAALWKPTIITPIKPPTTEVCLKAPSQIWPIASGIILKFIPSIIREAPTNIIAINGTIFSVTLPILLIPPIITTPTNVAITSPNTNPDSISKSCLNCAAAWFAWNIFPPPKEPPITKTAYNTAKTFPNPAKFFSFNPFLR